MNNTSKWSHLVLNWFPGHMAKGTRNIKEMMKNVNIVVEVRDARIPFSSSNTNISSMIGTSKKNHVIILNKSDLACEKDTRLWTKYFNSNGSIVYPASLANQKTTNRWSYTQRTQFRNIVSLITKGLEPEDNESSNPIKRKDKALVVGFPNVGKSTFINKMVGRKNASVAAQPGWTRGLSFYKVNLEKNFNKSNDPIEKLRKIPNFWLVDSPGVMIPERLDSEQGLRLAICQIISDEVVPDTHMTMAEYLHSILKEKRDLTWKNALEYNPGDKDTYEKLLNHIKVRYGKSTEDSQARFFLNQFRKGVLGRYTLETPDDIQKNVVMSETGNLVS